RESARASHSSSEPLRISRAHAPHEVRYAAGWIHQSDMMLSRRRFLIGGSTAMAASLVGAHHWRRFRRPSFVDIVQLIQERLAHLDLDPAGVERFAREYDARFGSFAMSVHHRTTWGGLLRYRTILHRLSPLQQQAVLEPERRLVGYYLR